MRHLQKPLHLNYKTHNSKVKFMLFDHREIAIDSIIDSTYWNLHPKASRNIDASLHDSFTKLGVITPPLLMETDDSTFVIISGHKRIAFSKSQPQESLIHCRVIQEDIDPHLLFEIVLLDMGNASEMSLVEKARFLSIASDFFPQEKLPQIFFDSLRIKRKQSFLTDLLRLLDQDTSFMEKAHSGLIQEQMLSELLRMKNNDRDKLVELFSQLNLGVSKQRKMLNLLRDAAYKESLTINEYLHREEIRSITENENLNIPQKIKHLDQFLQQEIYPKSFEAENDFISQVKELQLQKNQSITHSQAFEKDTVVLSTEFESLDQCRSYLQRIS